MNPPPHIRRWTIRIVKLAILIELTWLVVINTLLQIPYTQAAINAIRPEKFHVSWERAWSPYPARVYLRKASANGNSRSQVWQVDVDSASGSIRLLPLIFKRAWVHNVNGNNVTFQMRPRTKPDKDFSRVEAFFPVIEGREVTPAVTTPRKKKRRWHVAVDNIHVSGDVEYWIYQLQGSSAVDIDGGLNYLAPGGPFDLELTNLDVNLEGHYLNADYEVFRQGSVKGSMGFTPFMPRENKGLALLDFLLLDVNVDIDVNSLKFIKLFLLKIKALDVDGSGHVNGRLRFDKGGVLDGTDLSVDARDLQVNFPAHQIHGSGDVDLKKGLNSGGQLTLGFRFLNLELIHKGDTRPVVTGDNLLIKVSSNGQLLPKPGQLDESTIVDVEIEQLGVPDLAVFQGYIPPHFPLSITGGKAVLAASLQLKPTDVSGHIQLESGDARVNLADQDLRTDLKVDIMLAGGRPQDLEFDLSGSQIALNNVMVSGEKAGFDDQAWAATLKLLQADVLLADPLRVSAEAELSASDSRPIAAVFRNQEGWRPKFIARALTVEDIDGTVKLEIEGNRVVIPTSWITSDNIEVGARAVFSESGNDGVVYLKYKKIDAVLKLENGKKNIDLTRARGKYESYETRH